MNTADNGDVLHGPLPTEEDVEAEVRNAKGAVKRWFKVASSEKKLVSVLCLQFFMISYVYSVIRDMKDALVLSRLDAGSIPYLKMAVVLPANICAIGIIQQMLRKNSMSRVFSRVTLFFCAIFMCYGLLFKFETALQPSVFRGIDPFADGKKEFMGLEWTRAFYLIGVSYITTSIYLFAELWGACVLSFLFLSFVNSICTKKQNHRYLRLLLVSANIGLILSGLTMNAISWNKKYWESWDVCEYINVGIFLFMGAVSMLIYFTHTAFERSVLLRPVFTTTDISKKAGAGKHKVGFLEGLKQIFASKLVLSMSFAVLAYGIIVNMLESPFKSLLPKMADSIGRSKEEYVMETQGMIQIYVGVLVTVFLLLRPAEMGRSVSSWLFFASVTPIFMLLASTVFFPVIYANVSCGSSVEDTRSGGSILNQIFHIYEPWLALEMRTGQVVVLVSKMLKYASFDFFKEVTSMAIDPMYRPHYKSIFDGVCGKLGKACGSLITSLENAYMDTTDIRRSAMISFCIIIFLCACWLVAVLHLLKKYRKAYKHNKNLEDEKLEFMTRIFG